MQRNLVLALHGFLGQSSDWNPVKKNLLEMNSEIASNTDWIQPSLFSASSSFDGNYDSFCEKLIESHQLQSNRSQRKIFIGYSLGGRLGLHLLKNYADQFDHFTFVSTHPGLTNETEKQLRAKNDEDWSLKITPENWDSFLKEWNAQGVLKWSGPEPLRLESDYNLKALQDSLIHWSLAEQQDLRDLMQAHQDKITWVVGTADSKFLNLAEDLLQKKILLNVSRIFSGHRILFENPKELALLLLHQLS